MEGGLEADKGKYQMRNSRILTESDDHQFSSSYKLKSCGFENKTAVFHKYEDRK